MLLTSIRMKAQYDCDNQSNKLSCVELSHSHRPAAKYLQFSYILFLDRPHIVLTLFSIQIIQNVVACLKALCSTQLNYNVLNNFTHQI